MSLQGLSKVKTAIDAFINSLGQLISWFTLLMVFVMTLVVVLRYGFNIGWIAMQESVVYMHAFLFMLGAAYTLNKDEHVRVDIFYQRFSAKNKAWVDLIGTVFILFPVCGFIFYYSFGYVMSSWRLLETSAEAGGIPAVFVLKTLLLVMPTLMVLQGIATLIAQILTIADKEEAL
ncbi:MAG: TRAP transporter small permease subunit [Algicola sp.]|nr:TRAP transporter small permease subunit [Algicola sp.]